MKTFFIFYIFISMSAIAKMHLYWLKGGFWPGKNHEDLIKKLIGKRNSSFNPLFFILTLIIFVFMALYPLSLHYKMIALSNEENKMILSVLALIFFFRSIYLFIPFFTNKKEKVFLDYNKKIYAPLSLSLSLSFFYLAGTY